MQKSLKIFGVLTAKWPSLLLFWGFTSAGNLLRCLQFQALHKERMGGGGGGAGVSEGGRYLNR